MFFCRWWVLFGALGLAGCGVSRPIHYRIESSYTVKDPQFARTVGSLLGPALVGGNRVRTYENGDAIFPAMVAAIRSAKESVTLETYIYWSGRVGQEVADALAARAQAGVKVRVLVDWIGALRIDRDYYKELWAAGVEVHAYHAFHFYDLASYRQLNKRTHRKLLVVDGRMGFIGGVGIADRWDGNAQDQRHWRDNHYRVEGPVVAEMQGAFVDNWMQTTGEVLEGDAYFPALAAAGGERAQVFKSAPQGGAESMELLMLLSIAHAGETIRIESAYFVPNGLMRDALAAAARRGVSVEIIVPGPHMDKKFVLAASRADWGEMLKAGVAIYEYQPTMIHSKLLVVDGVWTSVGSSNMDWRSFRINEETNLNVLDAGFAAEQLRMFEGDKAKCKRVTLEAWRGRPLGRKALDEMASWLDREL